MISQRLRIFLHDITHHFLTLCSLLLLCSAILLSLLHWILPLLPGYSALITHTLSEFLGAEINFDSMQTGWHRLQPEIDLQNVEIKNAAHQVVMRIPQVYIRFGLFTSLLHRKPEISLLQIKQWQVRFYQNDQAQWQMAGIEHLPRQNAVNKIQLDDLFSALSQIHHLELVNGHISIQAKTQPSVVFAHTNLDWTLNSHTLAISGNTEAQGPSTTPIQYTVTLQGDLAHLSQKPFTAQVYCKIKSLSLAPWLSAMHWQKITWRRGIVQGALWANWQKDHWQQAAAKLHIEDLDVAKPLQEKIWRMQTASANWNGYWQNNKLIFQLQNDAGALNLAKLFRNEIAFDHMMLIGDWQTDAQNAYQLQLTDAQIQTPVIKIHAKLKLAGSPQTPTEMNMLASAQANAFNHISHYLPAGIMAPALVDWLDHAILQGKSLQAQFLWRGPLASFPFHDQSGTMQIAGQAQGLTLDYTPGFPKITNLDADLYFTAHDMHIAVIKGLLANIPLSQVTADIPFKKNTTVSIHGILDTDLTKAWGFLAASKLAKPLAPLLQHTDATGPAHIDLHLQIPLFAEAPITYQGQVLFNHDALTLQDAPIHITDLSGATTFTDQTLTGKLLGNWLGLPWQINLDKKSSAAVINLDFSGIAPIAEWVKNNFLVAANWFAGTTNMSGHIEFTSGTPATFLMHLTTTLQNLMVRLPFHINKPAASETPFHITLQTLADQSIHMNIKWLSPIGAITLTGNEGTWSIHTPTIEGSFAEPNSKQNFWDIHLANLDLSHLDEESTQAIDLHKPFPAMNIQANNVQFSTMRVPAVLLKLRPKRQGFLIEHLLLRTDSFTLNAEGNSEQKNTESTHTHLQGNLTTDHLAETLVTLGLGDLLTADHSIIHFDLFWPGALWQFDRDQLTGTLNFTTAQGIFKKISAQTNNKMDIGRMLSILSIQALPEHLASHFNDMTEKGFSFKRITGALHLTPNQVNRINIQIHGALAEVLLQGCANLESKKLNLIAKINPSVTGSLPVIVTIAGGPLLGAVGFVANQFIEPLVGKLGETYYAIQGDWHNPETNKITSIKANDMLRMCD